MIRRPPNRRRRPPAGIALAAASALLAGAGIGFIVYGLQPVSADRIPAARPPVSSPTGRPAASSPSSATAATTSPSSVSPTVDTSHELTVTGDGSAGDHAIQQVLENSARRNITTALEGQLTTLGRKVWLAEVTGSGRGAWPTFFTGQHHSWLYTHVRIQAAIARGTTPGHADVQLVWAGIDPTGQKHEDEPGALHLVRTAGTWLPVQP